MRSHRLRHDPCSARRTSIGQTPDSQYVRHRRHLRLRRQTRGGSRGSGADERAPAPSRPGRWRCAHRTRRRPRASASRDHRRRDRPAAALQRGRQRRRRVQRRDLQLPGTHPGTHRARARVQDAQRHRGDRACVGGVGRSLRAALPRHVRVRPLGPEPADAVHGPRPSRREAALLRAPARWSAHLRIRTEGTARPRRIASRDRSVCRGRVLRARLRARAAHHLPRVPQAAARRDAHGAARTSAARARVVLGRALLARQQGERWRGDGGTQSSTA